MAQFGEEELISFVKCIIQGILVGHHDRTRAISYIIKSGTVRGKSRTRPLASSVACSDRGYKIDEEFHY